MTNIRADFWEDLEHERREADAQDWRPAQLQAMSWLTADITVVDPQPEYEPRPRVRSHEVPRSYTPMTPGEWFWVITGAGLVAVWVGLFLLVLYAVTVG